MYSQSSNPLPRDSSTSRLALDNLLRRELKVSDPNDPKQVAEALLGRYKETPKAIAINREAQGVPFLLAPSTPMSMMQAPTSSDAEMQQAMNDVERDLKELTTNSILKDITPELEGWGMAIRSAIQEGVNSARFALDPRQRDKTFGIRRSLGDYARLARLVGALTPTMSLIYRKFAQSLDEVAAVLLVMMGEALANLGFSGGKYLLQAPYSELQVRRDAAIYALRNLVGATQEAYAPNEWPRGLNAYREIFKALDQQGQGDLRVLLVENELARIMDTLIQRAGQGSVEGLRQLGATAQLDLERLHRLVTVGTQTIQPASPPLTAFLESLALFVEAFNPSGGFRLLRIARPPILFYGLYGMSGIGDAEKRMLELVLNRNLLADKLDCYMQCGCTIEQVKCQIKLDKVLYDLDRAIDLYAVGKDELGKGAPEFRALAYSYVVDVVLFPSQANRLNSNSNGLPLEISDIFKDVRTQLFAPVGINQENEQLGKLVNYINKTTEEQRQLVYQELVIQQMMESQWENLVKTMAPSCVPFTQGDLEKVIEDAKTRAFGTYKPEPVASLPPNYEESLKKIVDQMPPQLEDISEAVDTIAYNLGDDRPPPLTTP